MQIKKALSLGMSVSLLLLTSACASTQTESSITPPDCPRSPGLTNWAALPSTLFTEAPVVDKIPPGVKTEQLYFIIGESREATEKYNSKTLPNIQAAAEKQDEKVDEYNKKIEAENIACDGIVRAWIKKYNPDPRSKILGLF